MFENAPASKLAFWDGANTYNVSLRGMVALAVDQTAYQQNFTTILRIVQAAFIGGIGLLLLLAIGRQLIAVEGALLIIAMLMLAPMSSRSHFVQLMLPYAIVVAATLKDRKTAWLGLAVLTVSFILCTTIPRDLVPRAFSEFLRARSDMTWGTLALVIYLAQIIVSPQNWAMVAPRRQWPPLTVFSRAVD